MDILNAFLHKHMQISTFMLTVKYFLWTLSYFSFAFSLKTMSFSSTVLRALFTYFKRRIWLWRPWRCLVRTLCKQVIPLPSLSLHWESSFSWYLSRKASFFEIGSVACSVACKEISSFFIILGREYIYNSTLTLLYCPDTICTSLVKWFCTLSGWIISVSSKLRGRALVLICLNFVCVYFNLFLSALGCWKRPEYKIFYCVPVRDAQR